MSLLVRFRSNGTGDPNAENKKSLKSGTVYPFIEIQGGAGLQLLKIEGKLQSAFVMMGRVCLTLDMDTEPWPDTGKLSKQLSDLEGGRASIALNSQEVRA